MSYKVAIIGLGYVGLPLAVHIAEHYPTVGFDIKLDRVKELQAGFDTTCEVSQEDLQNSKLMLTSELKDIYDCDIYIITVPTPVDLDYQPDLTPVRKASEMIGKIITKGNIIVFESTVYPGVTEEICAPILEKASGMKSGIDFFLGYSPERVNPGDKQHTVKTLTKVVSGQDSLTTKILADLYGAINNNNIFVAKNIKTAEAAKVIENAQRDINIAFINEITMIFNKMGLSAHDILEAAQTKWNFLPFTPGLVGGHCIGVDPYYLAYLAKKLNHHPEVILSGRKTNEKMSHYVASQIHEQLQIMEFNPSETRLLVMGITFKENIPDIRNSKIFDFIASLKQRGYLIDIHDPYANPYEVQEMGIELIKSFKDGGPQYDAVIGMVAHTSYQKFCFDDFKNIINNQGLIADFRKMWPHMESNKNFRYWTI